MRRYIAPFAALAVVLGFTVVSTVPAVADVNSPAANAVLRGAATLGASGAGEGSLCVNRDKPRTILELRNAANQVVATQTKNSEGPFSYVVDTHSFPNGAYTVRAEERNRTGTVFCSNNTKVTTRTVSIDNYVDVTYTGALSAAKNTTATVSAKLVDPHLNGNVLANRPVVFSLSGGSSVTANTNAQGVATASLPISGPPRSATVSAAFVTTAYYRGDTASAPFAVSKNVTSTVLAQPAPVVHGQETSFTATVTATNGTSTPTGTVQFTVDGNNFGNPVALAAGAATSQPTTTLSTGAHTVGAVYSGDANVNGSSAATVTQSVGKAVTTTTLTSDIPATVSGQSVTFTASVDVLAPGVGQPVGGVQFSVDGQPYGTAVPLSGDSASVTISNLGTGNHDVVATYNGNADFASSSSATLTHGVDKADSTLALTSSVINAVAGQPVSFTAQVTAVGPGAGTPTGAVQFFVDGDAIGDPVVLVNGSATSPSVGLDAGTHVVSANYAGDASFGGAAENLDQVVAAAQTRTTVTAAPSPSVVGQSVTLTAEVEAVAPATGVPDGAIRFVVDGQTLAIVDLVDGAAEFSTSTLTRRAHSVRAIYLSGTSNFVTSTSAEVEHEVNKASTSTTVESSAQVSVFGQSVTLSATVAVNAPGAGAPTGTLTFKDGNTVLGTTPIDSGSNFRGSVTLDDLSVGQHVITASFDGDDDFNASSGTLVQKVQRSQTSVVVASSLNPAPSGSPVAFTATISPVAPGAGDPGGTVRFTINGANLGAPVPVVDGEATSIEFSSLSPGTYAVEASYSGDANFVASNGILDQGNGQQVARAATTVTAASAPEPSAHGAAVTVTTTVVAKAPATGRPTGAVQIWEGNQLLGATSLVPGAPRTGVAEFVTTSLTPGTHSLRAVYVGNFNFDGGTATTTQSVGLAATVTGVESDRNPASYGDTVTLTGVVEAVLPGAAPSGTVTFYDGSQVLGTGTLTSNQGRRVATLEVAGLGGGVHQVTAVYSGDTAYADSASSPLGQLVERAATHLAAQIFIAELGDNGGRVRATLTGADGTPLAGRTLTFSTTQPTDHSTIHICDAVTNTQGFASCDATTLVPAIILDGGYDVRYAGNADHLPSASHGTYFQGGPVSNP